MPVLTFLTKFLMFFLFLFFMLGNCVVCLCESGEATSFMTMWTCVWKIVSNSILTCLTKTISVCVINEYMH